MIEHAKRPGMPADAICSHHGVHEVVDSMSAGMFTVGYRGRIIFSFETHVGISKESWGLFRQMLTEETGIQVWNFWNGEDKQDQCGVTLMEFAPESIRQAIANYGEMEDVFSKSKEDQAKFDAFYKWWKNG